MEIFININLVSLLMVNFMYLGMFIVGVLLFFFFDIVDVIKVGVEKIEKI